MMKAHEPHRPLKAGDKAKTAFGQDIVVGQVHVDDHGRRWVEPRDAHETEWLIPEEKIVSINGQYVS